MKVMSGDDVRSCSEFINWREELISPERGSRVVHYYLDDSSGDSHLAVVGTERSVRHMLYVSSDQFWTRIGVNSPPALKWRSRREVVDWLDSFITSRHPSRSLKYSMLHSLTAGAERDGSDDSATYLSKNLDHVAAKMRARNPDIVWYGDPWSCAKLLKHYQAFCRNGIMVAAHSFVLVMSEEASCYLAYIEDMYEDKKGRKKVKVRWFHKNQEFDCNIPSPPPHPWEVFITTVSQVISAECINNLATVLVPHHYEKCLEALPRGSSKGIYLCFRQYSNNRFKHFDLSNLTGYFDQPVFSCLDIGTSSGDEQEYCSKHEKTIGVVNRRKRILTDRFGIVLPSNAGRMMECMPFNSPTYDLPGTRPLGVKFIGPHFVPTFKVNEKIEILCQDSGIRGCWFKGTVRQLSEKRIKVQYDDLQNEEECGKLEEWVPSSKAAAPDKLGMRLSGRLTIRPCFPDTNLPEAFALKVGVPVDVWWNDGWWEGVIVGIDSCDKDKVHVFFPGENVFQMCEKKSLRIAKDWVGNEWVDISEKPDILSLVSLFSSGMKTSPSTAFHKGAESGNSSMSVRHYDAAKANMNGEDKKSAISLSSGNNESMEDTDLDDKMLVAENTAEDDIVANL